MPNEKMFLSTLFQGYFEYIFHVYIHWEVCFYVYLILVINSLRGIFYGWMFITLFNRYIPLFCLCTCFMEYELSRTILLLYSHWKLHRYVKIILMIQIQYWFSWINRCKIKSTKFIPTRGKREYIIDNPRWVYLLSWFWIWCICIIYWDDMAYLKVMRCWDVMAYLKAKRCWDVMTL